MQKEQTNIKEEIVEGETNNELNSLEKNTKVDIDVNNVDTLDKSSNIEEINIEIPDGDPLILVKPQDVYYNMYRDMLIKAKETRKEALATFLEAKNIKTKYMLDDIDDSEEENEFYNIED